MLTNSTIALSAALLLATASAAMAAPKHPVRQSTAMPVNQSLGAGQSCDMMRYMIRFEGDPEITITAAQRRAAYVACYGKPMPTE
jgi:hypothetical protein